MTRALSTRLPVIIVGGGPVGLASALELTHHEVPVIVFEPRVVVHHSRPRAKTTSSRTMEHLRRWGLAQRLRDAASLPVTWSNRVSFVETLTGREITHIDGALGLSTSPAVSPETSRQVGQGVVEETLRAALSERKHADLRWGWRVTSVTDGPSGAVVTADDPAGVTHEFAADWVIGADGPRSVVRDAMGVAYVGNTVGRPNVNVTFHSPELWDRIPHPPSIHYWVLNPHAPGIVAPLNLDGDWTSITMGVERIDSGEEAEAAVRSLIGADIPLEVVATDPWQARMMLADHYRSGHLFLAGDAAHQNPPWGGHGFNTGVGDAVNLGWKLAAVLQGWAPEALLESYERERRPIEEATIALASSNTAALSIDLARPDDPDEAEVEQARKAEADRIRAAKTPEFHADGLVFGYGYGPRASEQAPTPGEYHPIAAAGNRLPHQMLNGVPLQDLLGREFTVIGPGAATTSVMRTAATRGIPLTHIDSSGPVLIVRPDQHIAWTGESVLDADDVLDEVLRGFA